MADRDLLAAHDVALVRADNPSPLTLTGTNTWIVGRDPCWVVDPGPDSEEHVAAVLAQAAARGGIGGVAVTHHHADHAGAVPALVAGAGAAVEVRAAALAEARVALDGDAVGPLEAIAVPGHAPDHLCYALGEDLCFTGDAVLGEGSVFIAPDPGALAAYLDALERLRARRFALLAPGHGPVVLDADAKLAGYVAHRLDRERRLVAALDGGARSVDVLLDAAWDDVPDALRLPATVTLFAHLDKLREEGRLPAGVQERPAWFARLGRHAH
ncbi:MAG TPA: MBL fold metallo-hydrolase [Baekduia sp.]|nr:MBL fold metallo-hydrolase [Baekduia sp.]